MFYHSLYDSDDENTDDEETTPEYEDYQNKTEMEGL